MAGLWDRVANRGYTDDPVASVWVSSAVYLVARGVFTGAQAKAALESRMRDPFSPDAVTDFTQILDNASTGTLAEKLDYLLRLQSLLLMVESKLLTNETVWRNQLGLT